MTNQLDLTYQNNTLNLNRLWLYSKISLGFLLAVTIFSSVVEVSPVLNISNIALCMLFLLTLILVKLRKKQAPLIKIEDHALHYFCPVKKELVIIPAHEITQVTSRFCELQIHTQQHTHCLNLKMIKQERNRWEIKEMIRKLALENEKQACNF